MYVLKIKNYNHLKLKAGFHIICRHIIFIPFFRCKETFSHSEGDLIGSLWYRLTGFANKILTKKMMAPETVMEIGHRSNSLIRCLKKITSRNNAVRVPLVSSQFFVGKTLTFILYRIPH